MAASTGDRSGDDESIKTLEAPNRRCTSSCHLHEVSLGKANTEELEIRTKRDVAVFRRQRRRELCRANQTRYRMRQRNQTNALEKRVQQLQHYIPVLELQRTQLIYDESQDMWAVVVEYCEKFRYGVKSEDGHQYSDQLEFLRSSMVQDVALGEHCGVQELMDWWRRYSSVFKDLQLQPKCMQRVSEGFMRVSAILSVTVSVFTLEKVFPNLKTVSLLSKLLGRRLRLPCCLWFEWDASSSRVVRVEMTVNYVTAMMKVFGNLSVVASVLAHAHITRYGGVQVCVASDS